MMVYLNRLFIAILIVGGVLVSGPALGVTPYDDVLVEQARRDLAQERYEEALQALTEAWEKGAHTPEKALLLGQTYRFWLDYPKAQEYLEQALRLKPDSHEAMFLLADTLIALNQPQEAEPYLKTLEQANYQPGKTAFLLGMVANKQERYDEALQYFRRAQEDPGIAQDAKFQESLVLAAQRRLKEAQKTLKETVTLGPKTQTGWIAKRYETALTERLKELRPLSINLTVGFDYDSNVTLNPGDVTAEVVSGQGDVVYTQTANVEYNPFPMGPFGLVFNYSYFQNFHPRISNYDLMSHIWGLSPTYSFKNSKLWLPFSYTYTDVESDKYYTAFTMTPNYLYMLTPKVGLEVGCLYARRYFWWPLFLKEDDRTGSKFGGTLGMYYFFKQQKGFLQARVSYEYDSAQGSNWDSSSSRLLLSALYPVNKWMKVSAFVDLMLQPFDHRWFNGNPLIINSKREDNIIITGLQTTFDVYKGLEFNVHYYYIRDDSNIFLYDYTRHIVGCQLGYRY